MMDCGCGSLSSRLQEKIIVLLSASRTDTEKALLFFRCAIIRTYVSKRKHRTTCCNYLLFPVFLLSPINKGEIVPRRTARRRNVLSGFSLSERAIAHMLSCLFQEKNTNYKQRSLQQLLFRASSSETNFSDGTESVEFVAV